VDFLKLILGFIILILGGNFLVKGSILIAFRYNISMVVVGLTVVSFATSAPELIVSIYAALSGYSDIAIGNVIGSNIANLSLVIGFTASIFPLSFDKRLCFFDLPVMIFASVLCGIFLYTQSMISFVEGMIFILLLVLLTAYLIQRNRNETSSQTKSNTKHISLLFLLFYLIVGALSLYFGSHFLIDASVDIARNFGITERVISVSVIAFGTSVPELSTSIIAAYKNQNGLSVGNLIGSNIFNIFAVLGVTSMIQPIACVDINLLNFDFLWMLGLSFLFFLIMILGRTPIIGRVKGVFLLTSYFIFLIIIF
jgi:cation:H+ antiporter